MLHHEEGQAAAPLAVALPGPMPQIALPQSRQIRPLRAWHQRHKARRLRAAPGWMGALGITHMCDMLSCCSVAHPHIRRLLAHEISSDESIIFVGASSSERLTVAVARCLLCHRSREGM